MLEMLAYTYAGIDVMDAYDLLPALNAADAQWRAVSFPTQPAPESAQHGLVGLTAPSGFVTADPGHS